MDRTGLYSGVGATANAAVGDRHRHDVQTLNLEHLWELHGRALEEVTNPNPQWALDYLFEMVLCHHFRPPNPPCPPLHLHQRTQLQLTFPLRTLKTTWTPHFSQSGDKFPLDGPP